MFCSDVVTRYNRFKQSAVVIRKALSSRRGRAVEPQSRVVEVVDFFCSPDRCSPLDRKLAMHRWRAPKFLQGLSMTSTAILHEITDITIHISSSNLFIKSIHESAVMAGTTTLLCTSPLLWMDLERTSSLQRLQLDQLGHGRSFRSTTVGNADGRLFFVSFCYFCVEFRWSFGGSDRFVTGSVRQRRAIAEPSQSHRQVPLNRVRDVWGVGAEAGRHFVLHGICHIAPSCSILLLSYFNHIYITFTSYLHKYT